MSDDSRFERFPLGITAKEPRVSYEIPPTESGSGQYNVIAQLDSIKFFGNNPPRLGYELAITSSDKGKEDLFELLDVPSIPDTSEAGDLVFAREIHRASRASTFIIDRANKTFEDKMRKALWYEERKKQSTKEGVKSASLATAAGAVMIAGFNLAGEQLSDLESIPMFALLVTSMVFTVGTVQEFARASDYRRKCKERLASAKVISSFLEAAQQRGIKRVEHKADPAHPPANVNADNE